MQAEQSLKEGDLSGALNQLQDQVRNDPANPAYRVFLFQLLSVAGEWGRALTQLDVAGDLDAGTLAMVQTYREALRCEALRTDVFAGLRSPLVFGDPGQGTALVLEALKLSARNEHAQAQQLIEQAYEDISTTSGTINGEPFEWIADADSRIGPYLEAIVNGNYYWIPFHRISRIQVDKPEDLRDVVWLPAHFTWANQGEAVGLIPARYPGSEQSEDPLIRLARKTEWQEPGGDVFQGLGQRMLATDAGEFPLLDVRDIMLNCSDDADEAQEQSATKQGE
jgi:type VI secretion system protein ImpE